MALFINHPIPNINTNRSTNKTRRLAVSLFTHHQTKYHEKPNKLYKFSALMYIQHSQHVFLHETSRRFFTPFSLSVHIFQYFSNTFIQLACINTSEMLHPKNPLYTLVRMLNLIGLSTSLTDKFKLNLNVRVYKSRRVSFV